jgi:hypothetical protein
VSTTYDAAAADAYIEAYAEAFDALFPGWGIGNILLDAWRDLWRYMGDEKPRELASTSSADHELEFYA